MQTNTNLHADSETNRARYKERERERERYGKRPHEQLNWRHTLGTERIPMAPTNMNIARHRIYKISQHRIHDKSMLPEGLSLMEQNRDLWKEKNLFRS